MSEKIDLGISDDYAVLKTTTPGGARWQFYYGYEYAYILKLKKDDDEDDEADDWGFVADLPNDGRIHLSGDELRAANPKLGPVDNYASPEEHLLTAIGILLERGVLVLNLAAAENSNE